MRALCNMQRAANDSTLSWNKKAPQFFHYIEQNSYFLDTLYVHRQSISAILYKAIYWFVFCLQSGVNNNQSSRSWQHGQVTHVVFASPNRRYYSFLSQLWWGVLILCLSICVAFVIEVDWRILWNDDLIGFYISCSYMKLATVEPVQVIVLLSLWPTVYK
jgi:hypothetical protein